MKVVQALGWYFPESLGGTEIYVQSLARRLKDRGYDVWIAAPDAMLDEERRYHHDGVEVFRYPVPAHPSRAEAQGRAPVRGAQHFRRWLEGIRPDVLHCHALVTGLGIGELRAAKAMGARVVVTSHTPSLGFLCQRGTMMRNGRELCDGIAEIEKCSSCELQHRGVPELLAPILGSLPEKVSDVARRIPGRAGTALGMPSLIGLNLARQRELLDLVAAFAVLTRWAADAVVANHGSAEKVVLNRLGIEANGFVRARRTVRAPVRFGFVGRFARLKGVYELAAAVSRLPEDLDFELELRGPVNSDAERRTAKELEASIGSDPRVRFEPPVSHAEIGRVLSSYDVLICPSTCLEGGPTIAMEAQAVGTPILASRIGGLAEIVEDGTNGRLLPAGDVEALATAIAELATKPDMLQSWRDNAPVPRTMEDIVTDYERVYRG